MKSINKQTLRRILPRSIFRIARSYLLPVWISLSLSDVLYRVLVRHLPLPAGLMLAGMVVFALSQFFLLRLIDRRFVVPVLEKAASVSSYCAAGASLLVGLISAVQYPIGPGLAAAAANPLGLNGSGYLHYSSMFTVVAFLFLMILMGILSKAPGNTQRFVAAVVFLALLFSVGLLIFDDYGVSWDTPAQRRHGLINLKYMVQQVYPDYAEAHFGDFPDLPTYRSRYYGAVFQIPLVLLEHLNGVVAPSLLLLRHLVTFVCYFLGAVAFFLLVEEVFVDWRYAIAGVMLYVLSPRIFADGFYNSKDAVFLSLFTISFYLGAVVIRKPSLTYLVLFAAASAVAANLRFVAVFLYAFLLWCAVLYQASQKQMRRIPWMVLSSLVYIIVYIAITPASWPAPVLFFMSVVRDFSDYPIDLRIMYLGEFIPAEQVPWHYLPVWILITTPTVVLTLFLAGLARFFLEIRNNLTRVESSGFLVFFASVMVVAGSVGAAAVLGSTLYNGWRQFYYLHTPLMIITLFGLRSVMDGSICLRGIVPGLVRTIAALALGSSWIWLAAWMIRYHPFQYVYFNPLTVELAGGKEGFERDYWGLSVRNGLEYVLEHDPSEEVYIEELNLTESTPVRNNRAILPQEDRRRIILTDDEALIEYVFFRHPYPREFEEEPYYQIEVDGMPILSIYRP